MENQEWISVDNPPDTKRVVEVKDILGNVTYGEYHHREPKGYWFTLNNPKFDLVMFWREAAINKATL